jgi:DNA-binding SARP family transcriptional activator
LRPSGGESRDGRLKPSGQLLEGQVSFAQVEFRILGPLEVRDGDRLVPLGGARQRGVLALLLTHANEVVSRDWLIDELWGERPPESAVNVLQTYVSHLRKALAADLLVTRTPGYMIRVEREELDLYLFEDLVTEADRAEPAAAATKLRAALELWRGTALADFAYDPFAQATITRLEELRLTALERRIEADLALGRHGELVGELEVVTREHPLREPFRRQLMLALYRSGRQAEALAAYRDARRVLVDQLGIDPSPSLQELERAILRQEPALESPAPASAVQEGAERGRAARSILVVPRDDANIRPLISIAEPLARRPPRELIVARLLEQDQELAPATEGLAALRDELVGGGLQVRIAAYTSSAPGDDAVQLATEQDVDLVLVDTPNLLEHGTPDPDLGVILRNAPSDVGVLVAGGHFHRAGSGAVVVPFGGAEHDWSAVEIAAWVARATETRLQLLGTAADRRLGQRDASRLLAKASLIVQAVVGIVCEPVLVRGGPEGVLGAVSDASLIVVGLSSRWETEGLGPARLEVARSAGVPTLLVRRGLRPGGLAPQESMTRFTWSLGPNRT